MPHDVRGSQRPISQAMRVILAVQDDDVDAAWEVLHELCDSPKRLRELVIVIAALASGRYTDREALIGAMASVDALAAPPPRRWYPGDPGDPPRGRGADRDPS